MNDRLRVALGTTVAAIILGQAIAISYLSNDIPTLTDTRTTQLEGRLVTEMKQVCTSSSEWPAKRMMAEIDRLSTLTAALERCPDVLVSADKAANEVRQLTDEVLALKVSSDISAAASAAAKESAENTANRLPVASDKWFDTTLDTVQRVEDLFKCPDSFRDPTGTACVEGQTHVLVPAAFARSSEINSASGKNTVTAIEELSKNVAGVSTNVGEMFKPVVKQLNEFSAASAVIQAGVRDYVSDARKGGATVKLEQQRIAISLPAPRVLNCADLDVAFGAYRGSAIIDKTLFMPRDYYEDVVMTGQPNMGPSFVKLAVRAPLTEKVNKDGQRQCIAEISIGPSAYELFAKSSKAVVVEIVVAPDGNQIPLTMTK